MESREIHSIGDWELSADRISTGGREPLVSWHGGRISRLLSVVGTLLDTSAIVYPRVSPFLPHRGNADLAADRGRGAR